MGIADFFKKMIKKKPTKIATLEPITLSNNKKKPAIANPRIGVKILDINPNVYLVSRAARLCIAKDAPDTEEERLKYIQGLMNRGHESILEHSNIVSLLIIPIDVLSTEGVDLVLDLVEVLNNCRYLHIVTNNDNENMYILIGGSIRGYMNIVRETSRNNTMLTYIKDIMYQSIQREFLVTLNHLILESKCVYKSPAELFTVTKVDEDGEEIQEVGARYKPDPEYIKTSEVDLVYAEDIESLYNKIAPYGFELFDVLKVATITFLFHNISRSTGNQLVRHRVAITQESQRYVEHATDKSTDFIDPIELHEHHHTNRYYGKEETKAIKEYLSKKNPFQVYKSLLSKGVSKEDARAWLPLGVTTRIMMTFTYKQLAKFLELRSSKEAQLEIRLLAESCCYLLSKVHPLFRNNLQLFKDCILLSRAVRRTELELSEEFNKLVPLNQERIEIDDTMDNISTQENNEMQSLEIKDVKDAEKYLKQNEELNKL